MSRDETKDLREHRGPSGFTLMTFTPMLPLLLVAVTLAGPVYAGLAAADGGAATDGKAIFLAEKCETCHSVQPAGIEAKVKSEKMKGPDLDAGVGEFDHAALVAFLRGKGELEGKQHKKPFKGTDEELATLIDWLGDQKAK